MKKFQNFSNVNAQLKEFQWNLGSRKTSCMPTILCFVIINSKRSENLPLVVVELKSFLLSWKYFDFWLKGQALLFFSDYDNNLTKTDPSVHPLCLWTLCELCGLWWSSVTHLCVCVRTTSCWPGEESGDFPSAAPCTIAVGEFSVNPSAFTSSKGMLSLW